VKGLGRAPGRQARRERPSGARSRPAMQREFFIDNLLDFFGQAKPASDVSDRQNQALPGTRGARARRSRLPARASPPMKTENTFLDRQNLAYSVFVQEKTGITWKPRSAITSLSSPRARMASQGALVLG